MLDGPKPRFPSSVAVATPEEGRRAVQDLKRRGADFVKLQSLIPREAVFAIADEAKKNGIPFAGHVPDAMRASEASEAGQKSFEHLIGIFEGSSPREDEFLKGEKSPRPLPAVVRREEGGGPHRDPRPEPDLAVPHPRVGARRNLLEERDLAHDPLAKYAPAAWKDGTWKRFTDQIREWNVDDLATRRKFVEKELDVVRAMHRAGVPFLAGTDTAAGVYVFPGFSLHDELRNFVRAGFTPLEALQTATLRPAQFLAMEDRLGRVEQGKLADLVLLDANPLDDVDNTRGSGRWWRTAASSRAPTSTRCCAAWSAGPRAPRNPGTRPAALDASPPLPVALVRSQGAREDGWSATYYASRPRWSRRASPSRSPPSWAGAPPRPPASAMPCSSPTAAKSTASSGELYPSHRRRAGPARHRRRAPSFHRSLSGPQGPRPPRGRDLPHDLPQRRKRGDPHPAVLPPPRLLVYGLTPTARALVRLGAAMGYRVTAVDPAADRPAFPEAEAVFTETPAPGGVPGHGDVRGRRHAWGVGRGGGAGRPRALPSTSGSSPAPGAREELREFLDKKAAGRASRSSRVSTFPAGLRIGAEGGEEIAVSILAEIVEERRKARKPVRVALPVAAAEEAVDPMCGMTVAVASARHTAEQGAHVVLLLRAAAGSSSWRTPRNTPRWERAREARDRGV